LHGDRKARVGLADAHDATQVVVRVEIAAAGSLASTNCPATWKLKSRTNKGGGGHFLT
jgi:hypothetical protein